VMSHDSIMISLEGIISTWASDGGPSVRTIVAYSPSGLYLSRSSPSGTPIKTP